MCVDAGISGGAREVLVLSVGNVLFGPRVSVLLGQTKINDEQLWSEGKGERGRGRGEGEGKENRKERERERGGENVGRKVEKRERNVIFRQKHHTLAARSQPHIAAFHTFLQKTSIYHKHKVSIHATSEGETLQSLPI